MVGAGEPDARELAPAGVVEPDGGVGVAAPRGRAPPGDAFGRAAAPGTSVSTVATASRHSGGSAGSRRGVIRRSPSCTRATSGPTTAYSTPRLPTMPPPAIRCVPGERADPQPCPAGSDVPPHVDAPAGRSGREVGRQRHAVTRRRLGGLARERHRGGGRRRRRGRASRPGPAPAGGAAAARRWPPPAGRAGCRTDRSSRLQSTPQRREPARDALAHDLLRAAHALGDLRVVLLPDHAPQHAPRAATPAARASASARSVRPRSAIRASCSSSSANGSIPSRARAASATFPRRSASAIRWRAIPNSQATRRALARLVACARCSSARANVSRDEVEDQRRACACGARRRP